MALNDLISDVLTRIRNAQKALHASVYSPSSKAVKSVLDVMVREGYIEGYSEFEIKPGIYNLKIDLRYHAGEPVIADLKRVSKPGRRVYSSFKKMPKVAGGLGISVLSTSKGMLSDNEARNSHVGGEVVCTVF
jgi:small subunit ribosomal protein S8